MKSWSKNTKILALTSAIIALVMTAFAVYFYTKIKWASQLMTFDDADPDFVDSILSYSVTTPSFIVPLIFFAIMFIYQYIMAAWFIVKGKTKQEKRFGYFTLVIGGLVLSPLYLLWVYFKKEAKEVKEKKVATWKVATALVVTPVVAVAPIIPLATWQGLDKPTTVKNVKFSTVQGSENIIEIFTDGFDPNFVGDLIKDDSKFGDFTVFNKYVVAGAETGYSFPLIMSGLKENIFNQYDAGSSSSSMTAIYADVFGRTIAEHLTNLKTTVDAKNPYLINPAGVMENGSYMSSISGDPKQVEKSMNNLIDKDSSLAGTKIQTVNWGQAKQDVAGSFGIAPYGTDQMFYEWMHKKSVVDNNAHIGTRLFMQEFLTHSPRITGTEGQLTFKTGHENGKDITIERSVQALMYDLHRLIDDLKNMKDASGRSVYDNSLIMVYGDHANHSTPLPHPGNDIDAQKFHSLAMMKLPSSKKYDEETHPTKPTPSDEPLYAPLINKMISNWEANKTSNQTPEQILKAVEPSASASQIFPGWYGKQMSLNKFTDVTQPDGTVKHVLSIDKQPTLTVGSQTITLTTPGFLMYDEYEKITNDVDANNKVTKTRNQKLLEALGWGGAF